MVRTYRFHKQQRNHNHIESHDSMVTYSSHFWSIYRHSIDSLFFSEGAFGMVRKSVGLQPTFFRTIPPAPSEKNSDIPFLPFLLFLPSSSCPFLPYLPSSSCPYLPSFLCVYAACTLRAQGVKSRSSSAILISLTCSGGYQVIFRDLE